MEQSIDGRRARKEGIDPYQGLCNVREVAVGVVVLMITPLGGKGTLTMNSQERATGPSKR